MRGNDDRRKDALWDRWNELQFVNRENLPFNENNLDILAARENQYYEDMLAHNIQYWEAADPLEPDAQPVRPM